MREVPGSNRTAAWTIHGTVVGDGPGSIADMPLAATGAPGSSLDPMQHRTLHFSGVHAPLGLEPAYRSPTSPSTDLLHF